MNTGKNRKAQGVIMTLTGGILWGLCGSCGQFLFQYKEATSNWLVPIRLMGAGILILFLLAIKNKKEILAVWEEPWGRRDILIFSVFGMMLCQYAYFTTIQYSNAGTATVLQYTGPAMILVWLCIREQRKPKLYELVALVCAMTGTFILATHGNLEQLSIPAKALAWGMAAAMALVVYTLQPGRLMKEYSNIRNEYFKSMLCLVIGFRGDVEMLSFLTKETERLERMYLQETYAQGPILAIQELAVRFLN